MLGWTSWPGREVYFSVLWPFLWLSRAQLLFVGGVRFKAERSETDRLSDSCSVWPIASGRSRRPKVPIQTPPRREVLFLPLDCWIKHWRVPADQDLTHLWCSARQIKWFQFLFYSRNSSRNVLGKAITLPLYLSKRIRQGHHAAFVPLENSRVGQGCGVVREGDSLSRCCLKLFSDVVQGYLLIQHWEPAITERNN